MAIRSFFIVLMSIMSFQNLLSSQGLLLDRFMQSNEQKKGSWDMRQPGRVLTVDEIAVIRDNLDVEKTKVYQGESQKSENRDSGLLTVTVLCAYLDNSVNKRDRYPLFIFGAFPAQAVTGRSE